MGDARNDAELQAHPRPGLSGGDLRALHVVGRGGICALAMVAALLAVNNRLSDPERTLPMPTLPSQQLGDVSQPITDPEVVLWAHDAARMAGAARALSLQHGAWALFVATSAHLGDDPEQVCAQQLTAWTKRHGSPARMLLVLYSIPLDRPHVCATPALAESVRASYAGRNWTTDRIFDPPATLLPNLFVSLLRDVEDHLWAHRHPSHDTFAKLVADVLAGEHPLCTIYRNMQLVAPLQRLMPAMLWLILLAHLALAGIALRPRFLIGLCQRVDALDRATRRPLPPAGRMLHMRRPRSWTPSGLVAAALAALLPIGLGSCLEAHRQAADDADGASSHP